MAAPSRPPGRKKPVKKALEEDEFTDVSSDHHCISQHYYPSVYRPNYEVEFLLSQSKSPVSLCSPHYHHTHRHSQTSFGEISSQTSPNWRLSWSSLRPLRTMTTKNSGRSQSGSLPPPTLAHQHLVGKDKQGDTLTLATHPQTCRTVILATEYLGTT